MMKSTEPDTARPTTSTGRERTASVTSSDALKPRRYGYDVLETALALRHGLDEADLAAVRIRIRHLRSIGFPEPGRGAGRTLDYDGDGFLKLVIVHDLLACRAAPTWAARTVLTGWDATRDALVRTAAGEALHLVLEPRAMKDTLGQANDLDTATSAAFTPVAAEDIAALFGPHARWRGLKVICCVPLLADLKEALSVHGLDADRLLGPPEPACTTG